MLSYIRKLYEEFLSEDKAPTAKRTKKKAVETPKVVPAPTVERPKPIVIELPDSLKEYATPVETTPKTKATPVVVPAPAPPKPTPPPPTPVATPAEPKPVVVEEEHALLFEQKEGKELSDKLSSMPIMDLKKSMGLNEKILTINELFGGDHKAFDAALTDLNALGSFEEAKVYMSEHLAAKYEWASATKKKKAQIFIKLVRRRYK